MRRDNRLNISAANASSVPYAAETHFLLATFEAFAITVPTGHVDAKST
jgi:hypothetical protein